MEKKSVGVKMFTEFQHYLDNEIFYNISWFSKICNIIATIASLTFGLLMLGIVVFMSIKTVGIFFTIAFSIIIIMAIFHVGDEE
jgi:hypothetical protein